MHNHNQVVKLCKPMHILKSVPIYKSDLKSYLKSLPRSLWKS